MSGPRLPVYRPPETHVMLRLATGELLRVREAWWKGFLQKFYWATCPTVKM